MNTADFNLWLQEASAGNSCVYFRGVMTLDDEGHQPRAKPEVAVIAWRLAIAGAATLTQRKTGESVALGGIRRPLPVIDYTITLGKFKPLYPSFPLRGGALDRDGRIVPGASKP